MLTICDIADRLNCKPEEVAQAMLGEMICFGISALPSVVENGRKVVDESEFEQWAEENMARLDLMIYERARIETLEAMLRLKEAKCS